MLWMNQRYADTVSSVTKAMGDHRKRLISIAAIDLRAARTR